MCMGMCIDVRMNICIDMCIDTGLDMCMDMCIPGAAFASPYAGPRTAAAYLVMAYIVMAYLVRPLRVPVQDRTAVARGLRAYGASHQLRHAALQP